MAYNIVDESVYGSRSFSAISSWFQNKESTMMYYEEGAVKHSDLLLQAYKDLVSFEALSDLLLQALDGKGTIPLLQESDLNILDISQYCNVFSSEGGFDQIFKLLDDERLKLEQATGDYQSFLDKKSELDGVFDRLSECYLRP